MNYSQGMSVPRIDAPAEASIQAINLFRVYNQNTPDEYVALRDITFTLHSGAIYGLLGPNGAGKTTLLRILATLILPSAGTARINGLDLIENRQQIRGQIGFISETTGLYDRLTPREFLVYFGHLYSMDDSFIEKRIDELSALLDMKPFLDKKCELLSHGQRQRVSIARSMLHSPDIFILDEPTTGLDVITARTIIEFIKYLGASRKLVLIATHDMLLASKLCDRVLFLHRGRILREGSRSDFENCYGRSDLEDIFLAIMKEAGESF